MVLQKRRYERHWLCQSSITRDYHFIAHFAKQIQSSARKKIIKESIADKKRFEKNDKQKVCTFANESIKYVAKNGKGKLNKVRVVNDVFGSIL